MNRRNLWGIVVALITGWLIGTLPSVEIRPDVLALVLAYIASRRY